MQYARRQGSNVLSENMHIPWKHTNGMCLTLCPGTVKADEAMISTLTDGMRACDDRILFDNCSFIASSITYRVKGIKEGYFST